MLRAAGLAGPAGHRRGLRRRGAPRHHVRRHLFDLHAGRRGAGAGPAELGAGGASADRRPGPSLRAARPRPPGARCASPTSSSSTRPPSATAPCAPATTCPAGPAGSTPRRSGVGHVLVNGTEIVRDGDVHRAPCPAGCCARATTPTRCTPGRTGPARLCDAASDRGGGFTRSGRAPRGVLPARPCAGWPCGRPTWPSRATPTVQTMLRAAEAA